MKKKTIIIIIIASVVFGYLIGTNKYINLFSSNPLRTAYVYKPQIPAEVLGETKAFSDIVKAISPTVVNISTTQTVRNDFSHFFEGPFGDSSEPLRIPKRWEEKNLASGVIVSSDGYIITNYHVVEKGDEIKVTLFDKQEYKGKIIGTDPKTDVAVIKISVDGLPAINLGNSDNLQVGEFVLAFGNPYGFSHTVTMGIISAIGRANVGIADYEDFIQTDAAINPGNSGGPLVNIKGELIGINTAIFTKTGGSEGIGFAVPINMVQSVMKQLINEGRVTRGWLGVSIQDITQDLAGEFGLKTPSGILVSDIVKGSPAEQAGLNRGDVIIEINGKTIKNFESLRNIVSQSEVGSTIKLKVVRGGKTVNLHAKVSEFPKEMAVMTAGKQEAESLEKDTLAAGLSVIALTPGISKQLGLSREERGVVVVSVETYSPAEESGIKKGDVIQEINKQKINNLRDFNNAISGLKKGDTILLFVNRDGRRFYITLKSYS